MIKFIFILWIIILMLYFIIIGYLSIILIKGIINPIKTYGDPDLFKDWPEYYKNWM